MNAPNDRSLQQVHDAFDAYFHRLMAEELANEPRERAIEMQREAGPLDDGQETDLSPLDEEEAVKFYEDRRGA